MTFKVTVDDRAVMVWLDRMPENVRKRLTQEVNALAQKLRSHVVKDKLLGQVLNRVTGRLGQSIQKEVESTPTKVTGFVYSAGDVKYAGIHEFGGEVKRYMTQAWGRPVKNPRDIIARYPERSFLRSSLEDMQDEIIARMTNAVGEGVRE